MSARRSIGPNTSTASFEILLDPTATEHRVIVLTVVSADYTCLIALSSLGTEIFAEEWWEMVCGLCELHMKLQMRDCRKPTAFVT